MIAKQSSFPMAVDYILDDETLRAFAAVGNYFENKGWSLEEKGCPYREATFSWAASLRQLLFPNSKVLDGKADAHALYKKIYISTTINGFAN